MMPRTIHHPDIDRAIYSGRYVTTEQIMKACEALGLDPRNTFRVDITPERVVATEFVIDEEAHARLVTKDGECLKIDRLYQVRPSEKGSADE